MVNILLIEDEQAVADSFQLICNNAGFKCHVARLGYEGVEIALSHGSYDAIVVDLKLPDIDGYNVLQRLRAAKLKIPIMILSGLSSADKIIKALGLGADDFIAKPPEPDILIAKIKTIIRRSKGHSESVIRFDKVALNLDTRNVEVDGQMISLTNKEYLILELLATRKGTVLTKEMFLNHLYGGIDEPEIKIIDVFVCKLRKKLADKSGGVNYIETIWGRGYMLNDYETANASESMGLNNYNSKSSDNYHDSDAGAPNTYSKDKIENLN